MIVSACRSARSRRARRSALICAESASISPRSHSRTSVATWSLRDRAVCSRLPASPTSSVRRFSMARWTSSSASFHANSPRPISPEIAASPRSMASKSAFDRIPAPASIRAWARDPAMSTAASRWSNGIEALKRRMRSDIGSAKRPDQVPCCGNPAVGAGPSLGLASVGSGGVGMVVELRRGADSVPPGGNSREFTGFRPVWRPDPRSGPWADPGRRTRAAGGWSGRMPRPGMMIA